MDFTERTELERGFGDLFRREVWPALTRIEGDRQVRLRKAWFWLAGALTATAAIAALILLVFGAKEATLIPLVGIGVLGATLPFAVWQLQAEAWHGSVADAVMPAICDHIGDLSYDRSAARGFPVAQMHTLGLVGSHTIAQLSDRLEGRYRGTAFELVEAHLTRRFRRSSGKNSTKTVFKGLLVRIAVPVTAPTTILIARDYGGIGNVFAGIFAADEGRGMPRVELANERFEAAFEVHAADPVAAREFLPPLFLESLVEIGEAEGKGGTKGMRAGFQGDWFYLALERSGDFLKTGSLRTPVTEMEESLHAIFEDLAVVRRIIDRLHVEAPRHAR